MLANFLIIIFSVSLCDSSVPLCVIIFLITQSFTEKARSYTELDFLKIIFNSKFEFNFIKSFKILFPKLKDGGVYAIEDIQTSYWEDYGGDSKNLNNSTTAMNFLKSLTDCLNHQEIPDENYKESFFDKKIVSIHFYHNLVFIHKGNNNEVSNMVKNHKRIK